MIKKIKKAVNCLDRLGQKIEKFETKYESQINAFKFVTAVVATVMLMIVSSQPIACAVHQRESF